MTDQKEYDREKYYWRKEKHICTRCGKFEATHGSMCAVCAADKAEYEFKKYHTMSEPERQEYLKNKREKMRALRQERKEKGLCTQCGKPTYRKYRLCYEHYLKQRNKRRCNYDVEL